MILQENSAARNRGITLASIKGIIGNVVLVIFKMIVSLTIVVKCTRMRA